MRTSCSSIRARITVKGDRLTVDWRGTAPQFLNRAFNAPLGAAKCGISQAILGFFWPDLPRGISVMNPVEVLTDEGSALDPGFDAPLGQSLQGVVHGVFRDAGAAGEAALLVHGEVLDR